MTKTCKNCGHDGKRHTDNEYTHVGGCVQHLGGDKWCTCKKFEAENKISKKHTDSLKQISKKPQKKGCGKETEWKDDLYEGCGKFYQSAIGLKKCGEIDKKWHLTISRFYCPSCSNHTRQTKPLGDHSEASQGLKKSVEVTPEDKPAEKEPEVSQRVERTSSGSDFNLSEKILKEEVRKQEIGESIRYPFDRFWFSSGFEIAWDFQNKRKETFIKKLKEEFNKLEQSDKHAGEFVSLMEVEEVVDKLVGEKLR